MEQELKHEEQKITKTMTIGEVVHQYPSVAEILMAEGVHCVGCGAAYDETIEQGLSAHGKTEEEIDNVVEQLNKAIPAEEGTADTLVVTEKAAQKLKEILKQQKKENYGLRVEVVPGGCSGNQYAFDIENKEQSGDKVLEVQGVKFYVDSQSFEMLKGARLDYVDSLQGAGFKIENPKATKSCGCGNSFR